MCTKLGVLKHLFIWEGAKKPALLRVSDARLRASQNPDSYSSRAVTNMGDEVKAMGWVFVILGVLTAIAGFASMASDIQIIVGLCGVNMVGIGLVLVRLDKTPIPQI